MPAGTAYGLTELERDAVRQARARRQPGLLSDRVAAGADAAWRRRACSCRAPTSIVDAKSGVSGAGKTPSERTHFSEVPRQPVGLRRVRPPARRRDRAGSRARAVTFTPHLVPLDRGILATIYVRVAPGTTEEALGDDLPAGLREQRRSCGSSDASLPEIKHVAHTNFCDIGWRVDPSGRAILVSVLDNLLKGASGQAVQNMNVMLGVDETTGPAVTAAGRQVRRRAARGSPSASRRSSRRWRRVVAAGPRTGHRPWRRQGDRCGAEGGRHREATGRRPSHHGRRRRSTSSSPCWRHRQHAARRGARRRPASRRSG